MRRAKTNSTNNPNNVTRMLESVSQGQPITAVFMNQLLKAINQLLRGNALPSQILQSGGARGAMQMKIADITADDYLLCHHWDGTTEGTIDIPVAKPYLLRNLASWNGLTFTYTDPQTREADDGTDTEDQVVVPAYVVGDIIYVSPANFTNVDDATPSEIKLLDENRDARAWAKVDA